ncbi:dTDP-glucose 4,6-dehydratase [Colwellia sp. Bg11-28]|uniref:dTDP-glucose 4,6-dehydratase n=1 Tax=Colwellia sp. Bg11-28 TaxID=2058305 RepID=UPI000C32ED4C|nr:dTDP-glucose 4,6-dehydratase [Colwellia sp. Bg11-28]PKH85174.1 dTDP-glucose 4,6-dehydratase [Colwellia sp. Bg11-28]
MTYTPKILLVTGAAGFIGSNFVHYWMDAYPESKVIGLDALTYAGNKENLVSLSQNNNFTFVHADILDTDKVEKLLQDNNVDTLVHFAAESHVDRSIHGPDAFFKTNIEGTHSLLKAAKKVWLDQGITDHRFHHVSTDEVYGTLAPDAPAFTETNQYLPNSPYAASKASSDHVVRSYHHTYGLNTTISNCSNNYGPYQFPEKLIPLVIANCLDGKSLPIYGDGQQIRDWLFVDDHNRGIDLILHNGKIDNTYNIGGNNEWANIDIVNVICELMDEHHPVGAPHNQLITYVKDRAGHDRRYAINASKIMNELGYKPQETFETGIRKTVQWYMDNEQWWRRIMDGSYKTWLDKNYE